MSRLIILFGSQTGTAQDVAEKLWQDAKRRKIPVLLSSMDDYDVKYLINERFAVFVCSTTGQGDEPNNMKQFWKFLLRRNLPLDSLTNLNFTVLGLGDSSYLKYNFVAKKLYRRLIQLSGQNFVEMGLADDQHEFGSDTVVDDWMTKFWSSFNKIWPYPINEPFTGLLPCKFKITMIEPGFEANTNGICESNLLPNANYSKLNPFFAAVLENQRLTPDDHFQDTRLIRLDVAGSNLKYKPGDIVVVQPANLEESVEEFANICGNLQYDTLFELEANDGSFPVPPKFVLPQPCTFRQCLQTYFDLRSSPRRSFFKNFSAFAVDEREKEKLEELSSAENQQDLFSYCNRPRRTVVEVLTDFQNTSRQVPLEYWFDLLTPIRPRSFSIASSPDLHLNEIHILLAVVRYKTILYKPRLGLCSNWLARLNVNDQVPIWIQNGAFKLADALSPCLMVGPGTGVAPFRSIINSRILHDSNSQNILFFGCRNEIADFYFKKEWFDLRDKNFLRFFVAFSRDQEKKIYVQNKIEENFDLVADLILHRNATIFIAGNAKEMPKDVQNALKKAIKLSSSNLTDVQIDELFLKLEKANRLQTETWS